MSYRALNNAPHLRYLTDRILDMVCGLNGRKNICIFGNVITLEIILKNEFPENSDLSKVTRSLNKLWPPNKNKKSNFKSSMIFRSLQDIL